MTVEDRIKALEDRLAAMNEHLALATSELLGFRCAFIHMISLVPLSNDDVERARQLAFALATDAIELDEIHTDEARVVLATVRKVFEVVAEARRRDTDAHRPNAS